MEQSLVTVVVPIYNVEKYLERCLSSIVDQTYSNLEILLIDDGSPDLCPQICEEWAKKDNRIKVIHKENGGLGMARNTGIEHATGKYIFFFDSDDYLDLNTIQKAVALAEQENAEIVVFGMSVVNYRGEIIRKYIPEAETLTYRGDDVQKVFLPDLIDNRNKEVTVKNLCFSAWACIYSMDLIRRVNWKFVSERQFISEDSYSLIWLYQYINCVAILKESLYFYCENNTSLTRIYREDRFDRIKQFYDASMQMAKTAGYGETILKRISALFFSFSIAAMKQIAAADLTFPEKWKRLKDIVNDPACEKALSLLNEKEYGMERQLLFWAIGHRLSFMAYVLVKAQLIKETSR